MSAIAIDIVSLLGAILVLIGYGAFLIYQLYYKKRKEKIDWSQRLGLNIGVPEKEKEAALSLIKEASSPDAYFKSKLPKVEGLAEWIQHAGLNIIPPLFVAISFILGILIFFVLYVVLRAYLLFSILLGLASSFILPWAFVTYLTIRRKNRFLEEFPIALDMIHRALRAGHSADRALDMVAEQMTGPMEKVFRTITDKMRLGEPLEIVLAEVSNRIGIDDFRMLAIVLVLQRETGGSLAEATENFAKIIRARQNLRKKVKALSAEVRVTATVLIAIPFFILGTVQLTTPSYLHPLFYTEIGNKLLMIGGLMLLTGIGIILRMISKEIY